jgi:SAM-dependent methyltransferase
VQGATVRPSTEISRQLEILRCPSCAGELLCDPSSRLSCRKCRKEYPSRGEYYDLYVDEDGEDTPYPPRLEHLHYSKAGIISLDPEKSGKLAGMLFRSYTEEWRRKAALLQEVVKGSGTSERARVEFMKDDRGSEEFKAQKSFTERKAEKILEYISPLECRGNKVLHVGCGGFSNAAIPVAYEKAGFLNYGVDVVRSYVEEFLENGTAHLANALSLPFAGESFDIVNYTDILEHLFDPLRGLREAHRVLKNGGFLILDTPNRGHYKPWNPLSLLRYGAGIVFPPVMPPRTITCEWNGEVYFHTEFSRRELVELFTCAGFALERMSPEDLGERVPLNWRSLFRETITGRQDYRPWFVLAVKQA